MHTIQKTLLKRLLNNSKLKYGQLTEGFSANDNVVFHLNQLKDHGLIYKEDSIYTLTPRGIQETDNFDVNNLVELGSKSLIVGFIVQYQNQYMLQDHPKVETPFFNLPNGKPYHSEDLRSELVRIVKEEMNIDIPKNIPQFDSLHIKDVVSKAGEFLFSDVFVVYSFEVKELEQLPKNMKLFTKEGVENLKNKWREIDICILREGWKPYLEYRIVSDYVL